MGAVAFIHVRSKTNLPSAFFFLYIYNHSRECSYKVQKQLLKCNKLLS